MTSLPLVPGLDGVPCAESAVSFIDGQEGILEYRGYPVQDLAEHCTFEESVYLVLNGELPNRAQLADFDQRLRARRELPAAMLDMIKAMPASGHPMKVVQAGTAIMGMFHPIPNVSDVVAYHEAIFRLVAQVPTLIAAFDRARRGLPAIAPHPELSHAANFLYMLSGEKPADIVERTFDAALILHIEHTMNASTFAGRVVASSLADPYAVVSSAVGALTGPLHGGANEEALQQLSLIPSIDKVEEIIGAKIDRKEKIMGLGHRIYKTKDPRSSILQSLAEQMLARTGRSERYEIAKKVEAVATARLGGKGVYPNVDFYSGIVYEAMGIATDLFTPIFAISRTAGWLAHAREQLVGNKIFRPEQIYTGKRERKWAPIETRG
jgi:citrate synthase